jgi:hypothetical protein
MEIENTNKTSTTLKMDWNASDFEMHAICCIEVIIALIGEVGSLNDVDPKEINLALGGNMDILKAARNAKEYVYS